ncbi:unnamed protein product [Nezara viridula]|uniref:Uncharacterized protein n=1 Tax=Nezara viridula TaxID=85310 RepID=A0A9P0E844_NEZVI|nr:unnamed protein product [Nezara viridula]
MFGIEAKKGIVSSFLPNEQIANIEIEVQLEEIANTFETEEQLEETVHWGEYPLRPEFLESTYFLYRATGDHHYLRVGEKILRGLQTHTRVPCGYAALSDVRSGRHDDR